MPKINPNVSVARGAERNPGKWLVEIKPTVTTKSSGTKPGIEIGSSRGGFEQWRCALTVIDEHPQAPTGAIIYDRLTWDGGKAESRVYALLRVLGYPVDEWRKTTDPAKQVEITPEHLIGRPFVFDCQVNEEGFLEGHGFVPFLAATADRGPSKARAATQAPVASHSGAGAIAQGEGRGGLPF